MSGGDDGGTVECRNRKMPTGISSLNDTRLLLDRAILTLENMPFQDEAVRKARVALESLFVLPAGGKGKR
jgi:hypothetical protein